MSEQTQVTQQPDADVVKAIRWCRLGRVRPDDDSAFYRAERLGLLAHDPIWRATERGEGVLIYLGLLDGKPAPERVATVVLWASCPNYSTPHFVTAWSDDFEECYPEEAARRRQTVEQWFRSFGDERDWRFWTTREYVTRPDVT